MAGALGWSAPAFAGSDNSSDTYSGDYQAGSLPPGTFLAIQYAGFAHSNSFVDPTGNAVPNSHGTLWEEFSRFSYFSQIGGHTVVWEAEVPFATLTDVNVPGTNNGVQGGATDPVVHVTYFVVADTHIQRWLGITDYLYLPLGRYDNTKAFNVATPHQFTDVPQIGYTEGLGKFAPQLNGVFFDLIANASFHSNGRDPIDFTNPTGAPPGSVLTYDTLTQNPSYDLKAFLRYQPATAQFIALGIEKSWGGETIASNGRVVAPTGLLPPFPTSVTLPQGPLALTDDDYLRGHVQFQVHLSQDFAIGGDVFHDFQRVGGFSDDFGAEIRLTKFFFPAPPAGGLHK
jgi:hypothetical protein